MNNLSKLPQWAQDKIAELEKELRRWQDLYIEMARDRMKQDPVFVPIMPPIDIKTSPPKFPSDPPELPGVYAYQAPLTRQSFTSALDSEESSDITLPGLTSTPPTGNEP